MLRLTDAAAARALELAEAQGCAAVLRVRIVGGGCAGLTWDLELGEVGARDGDLPRVTAGVKVVVDGVSAKHLRGAFLDVGPASRTGLRRAIGEGATDFVLKSVPSREVCACGESFEEDSGRRT